MNAQSAHLVGLKAQNNIKTSKYYRRVSDRIEDQMLEESDQEEVLRGNTEPLSVHLSAEMYRCFK